MLMAEKGGGVGETHLLSFKCIESFLLLLYFLCLPPPPPPHSAKRPRLFGKEKGERGGLLLKA